MSSLTRKPRQLLNKVTINLGCCSCRRPKLSSIFNPRPKSKSQNYPSHHSHLNNNPLSYSSSYSSTATTTTASSFSPFVDYHDHPYFHEFGHNVGPNTVAFEKESEDPYLDFRHSMLQMIVENEIYTKKELKELLNCFLQLNEPCLHGIIVRVFTEIWNDFFYHGKGNRRRGGDGDGDGGGRYDKHRGYVKPRSYEV